MPCKTLLLLWCLVAALGVRAEAKEVCIRPTTTGHAEYYRNDTGGHSYSKSYGDLWYGGVLQSHYSRTWVTFLKFDMDSLPDSCSLLHAELDYCQYESYGLPQVDVALIRDPVPLDTSDLFFEIADAPAITAICESPDGWVTLPFYTASLSLLDSCIRTGWSSFGLRHHGQPTVSGFALGFDSYYDAPHLRLQHTSSGKREAENHPVIRPQFGFAPNPAPGRVVMVEYSIASETRGTLILCDVLGRAAKSLALDPSGMARLDLRGLAPGVYMATLEAGNQSLTRKLVITAR